MKLIQLCQIIDYYAKKLLTWGCDNFYISFKKILAISPVVYCNECTIPSIIIGIHTFQFNWGCRSNTIATCLIVDSIIKIFFNVAITASVCPTDLRCILFCDQLNLNADVCNNEIRKCKLIVEK